MTWCERRTGARRAAVVLAGLLAAGGARGAAGPTQRLENAAAAASRRPNIVLVVVDTLRADHTTPYGWVVPTSPNLDATLARPGVVFERASAQAPWTIPSMVSLLTSRFPGEVIGPTVADYGIPGTIASLPRALAALGYETAAFVGNPALAEQLGFAQGFERFYVGDPAKEPPAWLYADHLTRMAKKWLAARKGDRPLFLYVHYVEPHDPYENPEVVAGRSPYYPDYHGSVAPTWPQGLLLGKLKLTDPASDVRHMRALYDSEVHWVDRWVGALLNSFDADAQRRTLFAFTADHGEELYDHGGWKHGRTMYDEVLRVPLVLRWDGRLPAGRRVIEPVRLIDLAPTLIDAAGAEPMPGMQGESLLPLLRGEDAARQRPANFAAHFLDGPRRPAAMLGRWKLALFDRAARVKPADDYEASLYRLEMGRLPRLALFDLETDPREKTDVSAAHPEVVSGLADIIHDHLGREVPGLRVLLAGSRPGVPVTAELRLAKAPSTWESYFLGAEDRVRLDADRLSLTLVGEALSKGVLLPEGTQILSASVATPEGVTVRLASGISYRGGAISASSLRSKVFPTGNGPRLVLWQPVRPPPPRMQSDPEANKRLKALGYTG